MRRFMPQKYSQVKPGVAINTFQGQVHPDAANYLNTKFGQLIYNKNMEYRWSQDNVYLQTKRGSNLIGDIVDTNVLGASIYYAVNLDTAFPAGSAYYSGPVYVFNTVKGALKAFFPISVFGSPPGVATAKASGLSTTQNTYYAMFGQGALSTIYGCNSQDGIFKIEPWVTGGGLNAIRYASVNSMPATDIAYSNISGRMFVIYGHKVSYSNVQTSSSSLSNLETYGVSSNAIVSPDSGTGFKRIIDDGQVTFLFKDTGVWYLPNASEDPTDWRFPKASEMPGTLSPKTVALAKYGSQQGIIYLAADKTLRFLTYQFENNAGVLPTLLDRKSHVISELFQPLLSRISNDYLDKCVAQYFDGQYILNYPSEGSNVLNATIGIDCEKLLPKSGGQTVSQPFWWRSENMNYTQMVVRSTDAALIGFNKDGYISKLFVEDYYQEDVPTRIDATGSLAINWQWFTGWYRYFQTQAEMVELIVNWKSENTYPIKFYFNSFTSGEGAIPDFDASNYVLLTPTTSGRAYYDISFWDIDYYSNSGQSSQNTGEGGFGEYFLFGAANTEKNSPATFYTLQPYFKSIQKSGLAAVS